MIEWDGTERRRTDERMAVLERDMETLQQGHKEILSKIEELNAIVTRYKGFIGGIAFVFSGLGMAGALLSSYVKEHWK